MTADTARSRSRARSVASMSPPANTVATRVRPPRVLQRQRNARPALPAAQPHTELTTIITVPFALHGGIDLFGCSQLLDAKARQLGTHRRDERFGIRHTPILLDCSPASGFGVERAELIQEAQATSRSRSPGGLARRRSSLRDRGFRARITVTDRPSVEKFETEPLKACAARQMTSAEPCSTLSRT